MMCDITYVHGRGQMIHERNKSGDQGVGYIYKTCGRGKSHKKKFG